MPLMRLLEILKIIAFNYILIKPPMCILLDASYSTYLLKLNLGHSLNFKIAIKKITS